MTPEFKKNIEALPSYFQSHVRGKGKFWHREEVLGLGVSLEELVEVAWDAGKVVTSNVYAGRQGERREVLDIYPIDSEPNSFDPEIIDFKDQGLYVWDTEAYKLKKSFLGEQPITDNDMTLYLEARLESKRHLPIIGFTEGKQMGDFMEGYQLGGFHINVDDTGETEAFIGDMKEVVTDQEFYFGLEGFLRRKGLLSQNKLLDPVIFHSIAEGRIAVLFEGEDKYFDVYWEFFKIDPEGSDVLGFKNVQYRK